MTFRAANLPAPLHLLGGLWAMSGMSAAEKFRLLRMGRVFWSSEGLDGLTVSQWMEQLDVPAAAREFVLEPLAIAALNELPQVASALPLAVTLRELLRAGKALLTLREQRQEQTLDPATKPLDPDTRGNLKALGYIE